MAAKKGRLLSNLSDLFAIYPDKCLFRQRFYVWVL